MLIMHSTNTKVLPDMHCHASSSSREHDRRIVLKYAFFLYIVIQDSRLLLSVVHRIVPNSLCREKP